MCRNGEVMMYKRPILFIALLMLAGICAAGDAQAQIKGRGAGGDNPPAIKRDLRVEGALAELDINYTLLTYGGFSVQVDYTDTRRHQECFIDSAVARFGNLELREVWSRALRSRTPLSAATMNRLLRATNKFGGWHVVDAEGGGIVLYYSAQVAADADGATLKSVINMVAIAADLMEAELSGKDEH